jgi:hypothetical protein
MICFSLLALVIGSLASAEERQLGTLESQLLLPVPAWQQWAVKAGVALGLTVALTVGVPVALDSLSAPGRHIALQDLREMALAVMVMTSLGLYLSSLATSGVRALMWSVAATIGAILVYQFGGLMAARAALNLGVAALGSLSLLMMFGATILLLAFGFANHRSTHRSAVRTALQLICVAACVASVVLLRVAALTLQRLNPS